MRSSEMEQNEEIIAGPSNPPIIAEVQVFQPVPTHSSPATLSEEEVAPTPEEIRASHAALIRKSKTLNDRGFTLSKDREEEKRKAEKAKVDKWPNTTIRIRFSDGTHIQSSFPSTSKMAPVYQFVRSALADNVKSEVFTLYQPPNQPYPEIALPPVVPKGRPKVYNQPPPIIKSTLFELQLVPQSVLQVRFENEALNKSDSPAPLQPALLQKATTLPAQEPKTVPESQEEKAVKPEVKKPGLGDKKPKWMQKGFGKK